VKGRKGERKKSRRDLFEEKKSSRGRLTKFSRERHGERGEVQDVGEGIIIEPMTSFPGILTVNGQAKATTESHQGSSKGQNGFSWLLHLSHALPTTSRVLHQIWDERNPIGRSHGRRASGISSVPR